MMASKTSLAFAVAAAIAAAPSAAQSPPSRTLPTPVRPGQLIQPSAQSLVRQPTNLELQVQLSELRQEVAALNALLVRLGQREADRYWAVIRAAYMGCFAAFTGLPTTDSLNANENCQDSNPISYMPTVYGELREP
jgi:hypothetical protein